MVQDLQAASVRMPSLRNVRFTDKDWQWATATYTSRVASLPVSDKEPGTVIESLLPGVRHLPATTFGGLATNQACALGLCKLLPAAPASTER